MAKRQSKPKPVELGWYRIDIQNLSIYPVPKEQVNARADDVFGLGAAEAIATGRFRNPWAFYVRADQLTESERTLPERSIR